MHGWACKLGLVSKQAQNQRVCPWHPLPPMDTVKEKYLRLVCLA